MPSKPETRGSDLFKITSLKFSICVIKGSTLLNSYFFETKGVHQSGFFSCFHNVKSGSERDPSEPPIK